jgi:hypothetical protein
MLLNAINLILSKDKNINENQIIRDTIIKLKFIGTFQSNEKIDVRNLRVEQNTIFTPIKRMFYGESRNTTFDFLNTTIEKSFNIINSFIRTDKLSEKIFCKNILNDLVNCISGLKNIQRTYTDDKLFFCNVQTLIESIQAKLIEIKEQYPEIFYMQISENELSLFQEINSSQNKDGPSKETLCNPGSGLCNIPLSENSTQSGIKENNENKQLNNKKTNK